MRVLINAASANMGGALTYITNILREFSANNGEDRFLVILPPDVLEYVSKNIDHRIIELIPSSVKTGNTLHRMLFDSWTVPRLAKSFGADILFSTTGFGSIHSPCPQILLIRNTAYFCKDYKRKYDELGKLYHAIRFRRWWSLLSIMAADIVIFPSEAMRSLVEEHISLKRKYTEVLHYGFDAARFFQDSGEMPQIVPQMQKWKTEGYSIALHVSSYSVQKNLETVIKALPALISSGMKIKLVTTMDRDRTTDKVEFDAMTQQIAQLGLSDTVVSAGHLDHRQLHHLYQRADVFVFPSFTESFGHPLVEAMACDLPVLASDIPVNRELCGKAASYFEMFDVADCSNMLGQLLRDSDKRRVMKERSRERTKNFSWKSHVNSLLQVLISRGKNTLI